MTDTPNLDAMREAESRIRRQGMTDRLRIEQGPVVIVQTDEDPGNFGEPRVVTEDGTTFVSVPSFQYWHLLFDREYTDRLRSAAQEYFEATLPILNDYPLTDGERLAAWVRLRKTNAALRAALHREDET